MDNTAVTGAFGALAQETRLAVQVPHNTLSSHLGILARAGLVVPRREGRSIFYAADFAGMRGLIAYLVQDCCKGRPEVCEPLIDAVACCAPAPKQTPRA